MDTDKFGWRFTVLFLLFLDQCGMIARETLSAEPVQVPQHGVSLSIGKKIGYFFQGCTC